MFQCRVEQLALTTLSKTTRAPSRCFPVGSDSTAATAAAQSEAALLDRAEAQLISNHAAVPTPIACRTRLPPLALPQKWVLRRIWGLGGYTLVSAGYQPYPICICIWGVKQRTTLRGVIFSGRKRTYL